MGKFFLGMEGCIRLEVALGMAIFIFVMRTEPSPEREVWCVKRKWSVWLRDLWEEAYTLKGTCSTAWIKEEE